MIGPICSVGESSSMPPSIGGAQDALLQRYQLLLFLGDPIDQSAQPLLGLRAQGVQGLGLLVQCSGGPLDSAIVVRRRQDLEGRR